MTNKILILLLILLSIVLYIQREEYEKIILAHGIIPKKKLDIEHQA